MSSLKQQAGEVTAVEEEIIPGSTDPFIRIRPSKGWVSLDFEEMWRYRELLYFFVWRDIKILSKQTILGA